MHEDIRRFFARLLQWVPFDERQRIAAVRDRLQKRLQAHALLRKSDSHRHQECMADPLIHLFTVSSNEIHLSEQKKQQILVRTITEARQRVTAQKSHARFFPSFSFLGVLQPMRLLAGIILFVFAGGATLTFASESSLPGDFLYHVKTEVVEPFIAATLFTQEEKSAWEIERTHRRFLEVWELVVEGDLTDGLAETAFSQVEEHVQAANEMAQEAESQGNTDNALAIQSDLEGALHAHAQALTVLDSQGKRSARLTRLLVRTQGLEARSKSQRQQLEQELMLQDEDSVQLEQTIKEKEALSEKLEDLQDQVEDLDSIPSVDSVQRLEDAEDNFVEMDAAMESGDYVDAFIQGQEGDRIVTELEVLLDLDKMLELHHTDDITVASGSGSQDVSDVR